jgi:hypothetical protein
VIQHIDVHAVLQQSVPGYFADLVTRPTGRAVRQEIERAIAGVASTVTRMDFAGVGCIDYSCADEIIAKLLRESKVLLLRGLTDGHREAIEPVLVSHGLAVLVELPDGTLEALGLRETAERLIEELVARHLAARTPGGALALTAA